MKILKSIFPFMNEQYRFDPPISRYDGEFIIISNVEGKGIYSPIGGNLSYYNFGGCNSSSYVTLSHKISNEDYYMFFCGVKPDRTGGIGSGKEIGKSVSREIEISLYDRGSRRINFRNFIENYRNTSSNVARRTSTNPSVYDSDRRTMTSASTEYYSTRRTPPTTATTQYNTTRRATPNTQYTPKLSSGAPNTQYTRNQ